MSPQHLFWLCIVMSSSSTSLTYEKSERSLKLPGGTKLSSNITTTEPQLVFNDISEVQDVVNFLPYQTSNLNVAFNEERPIRSKDISLRSLSRSSNAVGEVAICDGDCKDGVKNSSSGSGKTTNNYDNPSRGVGGPNLFLGNISLERLTDVGTRPIYSSDDVPSDYYEDDYYTGRKPEVGSDKNEVTVNAEVRNNKESLVASEADRIPLAESSAWEDVRYTTDSGTKSLYLDAEIQDAYVTASSTVMEINDRMKALKNMGKAMQSEPGYVDTSKQATQHSVWQHTTASNTKEMLYRDKKFSEYSKSSDTGSNAAATVTSRIKTLSSIAMWGGIHHVASSEEPAGRDRTSGHTLGRAREPSRSPDQVKNDYVDNDYEVWRQNRGRSSTVVATDSKNKKTGVPHFPTRQDSDVEHTSVGRSSRARIRATTIARKKPGPVQDLTPERVPHAVEMESIRVWEKVGVVNSNAAFEDKQEKHNSAAVSPVSESPYSTPRRTYFTEKHKLNYSTIEYEGSTTSKAYVAIGRGSTVRIRATTGAIPPVPMQDGPTSEDMRHTVKIDPIRVWKKLAVVLSNPPLEDSKGKYNITATTNNAISSVSNTPVPHYGTPRRTYYTEKNKFNFSTSSEASSDDAFNFAVGGYNMLRVETSTGSRRRLLIAMQDGASSLKRTERMEPFRVWDKAGVVKSNTVLEDGQEKYKSIITTPESESTKSVYGTPRTYSSYYTESNKFNFSSNGSEGSTTPQGLKHKEEPKKPIPGVESTNMSEFRAQRESLTETFIPDDYVEVNSGEAGALGLQTKLGSASNTTTIPEDYEMCTDCVEDEIEMGVFNSGNKTVPELPKQQGKGYSQENAKSEAKDGKKIQSKTMANQSSQCKTQSFLDKIAPEANDSNRIRAISFSDYPWFVIIEALTEGLRCAGAMVTPRWLLTSSACLRSDDSRTDTYSVAVKLKVRVLGKDYKTVGAVFAPGGGVVLMRLAEPPESTVLLNGIVEIADPGPQTMWCHCVVLGMGRRESGPLQKKLMCDDPPYAVTTWVMAGSSCLTDDKAAPDKLCSPFTSNPGAPLACHRRYKCPAGALEPEMWTTNLTASEQAQMVLVGVSAADNKPGLSRCDRSGIYWNVGALQAWVERTIENANGRMERVESRTMLVPIHPYAQRLHLLKMERSLPVPRYSRADTTSRLLLMSLLAAAATGAVYRKLLLGS